MDCVQSHWGQSPVSTCRGGRQASWCIAMEAAFPGLERLGSPTLHPGTMRPSPGTAQAGPGRTELDKSDAQFSVVCSIRLGWVSGRPIPKCPCVWGSASLPHGDGVDPRGGGFDWGSGCDRCFAWLPIMGPPASAYLSFRAGVSSAPSSWQVSLVNWPRGLG